MPIAQRMSRFQTRSRKVCKFVPERPIGQFTECYLKLQTQSAYPVLWWALRNSSEPSDTSYRMDFGKWLMKQPRIVDKLWFTNISHLRLDQQLNEQICSHSAKVKTDNNIRVKRLMLGGRAWIGRNHLDIMSSRMKIVRLRPSAVSVILIFWSRVARCPSHRSTSWRHLVSARWGITTNSRRCNRLAGIRHLETDSCVSRQHVTETTPATPESLGRLPLPQGLCTQSWLNLNRLEVTH